MAVYFLDYEGGNDANSGVDFANRWKTITGGATAARIAPGDVIRIMKSPDPTSLGINATWTNKSATITLASALNALIHQCDTAWTASANVTCSKDTTNYRNSTGSAKAAIAAAFATGKVAYLGLGGTFDYSAYQGITFWLRVNTGTLAGSTVDLRLCSDATGDTAVDTFTLPAVTQTGQWVPVYLDKGAALGSAIQSISLYANADPGTIDILLNNLSTTKAAGNDCLNLETLIGKNAAGETWNALREISGTALKIDVSPATTPSGAITSPRGYSGTTETVATYIRKTIKTNLVAAVGTLVQAIQDSGSAGSLITFSGGWDRTAMTTQDGETWLDGQSGFGVGVSFNGKAYVKVDQVHTVRYDYGIHLSSPAANNELGTVSGVHCGTTGVYFGSAADNLVAGTVFSCNNGSHGFGNINGNHFRITTLVCNSNGVGGVTHGLSTNGGNDWIITNLTASNNSWHGISLTGTSWVKIASCTLNDNPQIGLYPGASVVSSWYIDTLTTKGNGEGVRFSGLQLDWKIKNLITQNNGGGILIQPTSAFLDVVISSLTSSGNTSYGIGTSVFAGKVAILASSVTDATPLSLIGGGYSYGERGHGQLILQNYNGVAGDNRIYLNSGHSASGGTIKSVADADRHTLSGYAWKFSPLTATYINADWPMRLPLAKFAVNASALVTVRAWVKRDNTGITAKLVCRGGQIAGVSSDVVATASAAAGTYEELEITFTPSAAGAVEIEAQVYGGTTYNAWFDDLTRIQA